VKILKDEKIIKNKEKKSNLDFVILFSGFCLAKLGSPIVCDTDSVNILGFNFGIYFYGVAISDSSESCSESFDEAI